MANGTFTMAINGHSKKLSGMKSLLKFQSPFYGSVRKYEELIRRLYEINVICR